MNSKDQTSAEFWLVFGAGQSIAEAKATIAMADPADLERWAELGRVSFRNLERLLVHVAEGGEVDDLLPGLRPSLWQRIRSFFGRLFA